MSIGDLLGKRLLKALLRDKDPSKLMEASIGKEDLFGDARTGYDFILMYIEKFREWPEEKAFIETTGIQLPEEDADLSLTYCVDVIRKRSLKKKISNYVESMIKNLDESDPDGALEKIKEASHSLSNFRAGAKLKSYKDTGIDRFSRYVTLKEKAGILGIKTPWPDLDKDIQGWIGLNVILARKGTGKAQPVSQPVLTPMGWSKMGWLKVGDLVGTVDGSFTKVTAIHPQGVKDVYKITFSDRTSTLCCGDHLWRVKRNERSPDEVLTTRYMKITLTGEVKKSLSYRIPICKPVQFSEKNLYLDPYLVGVLLGDGTLSGHAFGFTSFDDFIVKEVAEIIFKYGCKLSQRPCGGTYDIINANNGKNNNVKDFARYYGLLGKKACEKSIPKDYMFSSIEQRIAILQGLMDTDGSIDKNGIIEVTFCSEKLLDNLIFIVQSLGGTATKSYKKMVNAWRAHIRLPNEINPFRLPRKAKVRSSRKVSKFFKRIVSIEKVFKDECVCITVEHPSRLYLTNDFIVTHNSWTSCVIAEKCLTDNHRVLLVTLEMPSFNIERRIDAIHYKIPFKIVRNASFDASSMDKMTLGMKSDRELPGDILIADKKLVKYVADVYHLVLEYKPDIVIIDGAYRFKGKGTSSWESSAAIVADLQSYQEVSGIPWIATSQLGDATDKLTKSGNTSDNYGRARYAQEWEINPDIVLGLYQSEDLRLSNKMEIVKRKERDAVGGSFGNKFLINWDLEKMDFSMVGGSDGTFEGFGSGGDEVIF